MTTITRKQSNQTLTCAITGNKANVYITGATSTDFAGSSQNLTILGDEQSFTAPLGTPGTFVITAVVDGLPSGFSPELQSADDYTLLGLFLNAATLAAQFKLVVTQ